jgi:hypothetical protein
LCYSFRQMLKHKNIGTGIFFSLALVAVVLFFGKAVVNAAGESYLFYYHSSDEKNIEDSLSSNVFNSPTGISGLTATSVYAKGGIFGNSPYPFFLEPQISQAQGKPVYIAQYFCNESNQFSNSFQKIGDIRITLQIIPNLSKSTIEDQNHRIPATIRMTNAAEMTGNGNTVAFDYGTDRSKVPGSCLPSSTKTGTQNIGLSNYNHLINSAQQAWTGVKTTAEHDCTGSCANGGTTGNGADDDNATCIGNSSTTLEWIACPLITALSTATEKINGFIENQLDFSTGQFLPSAGGVHKAWTIVKDLVSSVLIILLLVMVISQAVGTGFFEAYTVKKVLPRLVIAVIGMQISWQLCIFFIGIANDLGRGLAEIIAAPFGGPNNLDLGSLLRNLGLGASIGVEVGLTALLVSSVFLSAILAPGALLVGFSIFMAVLVGLATVLLRNVIIIFCVMLSPMALLLWVMPNQGLQKYWKLWSDNFSKALLLFPLMVGIIYAGRIFAYVVGGAAGGATNVGFLNTIMILVGFFAPYAFLPKAFKWGGSLLSMGANAVSSNWVMKRGGELGRKELREHMERRQGEIASQYNPKGSMFGLERSKFGVGKFKVPSLAARGRLATRLQAGSFLPTERGRRLTIAKGDKWKSERNDEALAFDKRLMEMGFAHGYKNEYIDRDTGKLVKVDIEPSLKAGKQALVDMAGYDGDDPSLKRAAEMAIVQLKDSNSIWELQNARIGGNGKFAGLRVGDLPIWQKKLQTTSDLWSWAGPKRPDLIPTVTAEQYGNSDMDIMRTLAHYAPEEYKESKQGDNESDADYKKRINDEWAGQKGQNYRQRNGNYLSTRLKEVKETQGKLGNDLRLTDPERLTKSLRHGYASAGDAAGYAEGWWDEINNQIDKGNTAASQEMFKQFVQLASTGQGALGVLNHLSSGEVRAKFNKALGGNNSEANKNDIVDALITAARSNPAEAKVILDSLATTKNANVALGAVNRTTTTAAQGVPAAPPPPAAAAPPVPAAGAASTTVQPRAPGAGPAAAPGTASTEPAAEPVGNFNFDNMTEAVARGVERAARRNENVAERFTPPRTVSLGEGGELRIPHKPGEIISPGGVVVPPERRTRPPEE